MVDSKLEDITAATTPLTGAELVYIVQSSHDRKAMVSDIGGTPGGSNTQVQFNDGGTAFGGDAGFTYDKTNNAVAIARGTLTSASAAGLGINATWNNGGVTFDSLLKIDLTNTASAYSYLVEVNNGTLPLFRVDKFGTLVNALTIDPDGTGAQTFIIDFGAVGGALEFIVIGASPVDTYHVVGSQSFRVAGDGTGTTDLFVVNGTTNPYAYFINGNAATATVTFDLASGLLTFGNQQEIAAPALQRGNDDRLLFRNGSDTAFSSFHALTAQLDPTTIAALPASPETGMIATVNDGDPALAWGATVVNSGAGATPYLVWYNGTNWTVAGK